jgi:hypothetical protein
VDEDKWNGLRIDDVVMGLIVIVVMMMTVSMLLTLWAHGRLKLG